MMRLVLVGDHLSFRQPLAFMLGREPGLEVAGQAGSLAEARPLLAGADVALVDLDLPDGDGAELIRALRAADRGVVVLALTNDGHRASRARATEAAATGALPTSTPLDVLLGVVRRLAADATAAARPAVDISEP